jgi:hypothetical protein
MSTDATLDNFLVDHPITERPRPARREPSPRMQELDFLVGTITSQFDTGVRFESAIRPIMDGLYLYTDLHATYADGSWRNDGIWIVGWSEPDHAFQSYYVDAMGNQGTSSSPGWQDGVLEFVGSGVVGEVGVRTVTKDRYTRIAEDHFQLEAYVQVNGEWKRYDAQDCYRRR